MTKLEKRKRRIVLWLILLGCLGWGILGWMIRQTSWGLGTLMVIASAAGAAIAVESYDNPRMWRWLV